MNHIVKLNIDSSSLNHGLVNKLMSYYIIYFPRKCLKLHVRGNCSTSIIALMAFFQAN